MKATLILAAAFALTTSAALAQTAPTTSGATNGTATTAAGAGTNATVAVDPTANKPSMDNMSSSDRKAMRKSKKMKSSDGSMKTKTKM